MKNSILASESRGSQSDVNESEIDLSALLRTVVGLIRQNLLLIAAVVGGVVVLGIIITLLMTPKYQASAQILIEDRAEQIIENSELQAAFSGRETERFLQTQIAVIKSRALATFVVQSDKLDNDARFFQDFGSEMPEQEDLEEDSSKSLQQVRRDRAIGLLLEALEVTIPTDSRIARLTIASHDAGRSARIANLYAERFIEYNLNQKYESSSYAREFLANQLEETRVKLTQSEQDLNRYARAAGLIRVNAGGEGGGQEAALSVTNNQLVELNSAAAAATAARIEAEDRWRTVANQPALAISEVTSNSAIMQLVTAKAAAESQLAEELSTHKEGYVTVKAKRAQIAELDNRIKSIAETVKRSAQLNYQSALEKENSLTAKVNELRDSSLTEQERGVQYTILKREADTNRALYESLLSRFNQLNASAGAASNNVTIVDRAIPSSVPSSPNLAINIVLAFTIGLLLAAAVVALRYILDDAISSPEDVEKKLKLPLLGLIPMRDPANLTQELSNRRSNVNEAYSSLVTNLTYSTSSGLPKVLMITSSRQGEGKSTTARGVAKSIARLGKRVLLVDADLRRPTLHRAANFDSSGLTDYLIGEKNFDEVLHVSDELSTLSYVSALPLPPDPALLLAGQRVGEFINEARSRFDVVLLDCPPLLGLSDVPLLADLADGILFVIDGASFQRGAVKAALRRLELIDAKILGATLNRFSPKSGTDDYAYYAYNYYSYGNDES